MAFDGKQQTFRNLVILHSVSGAYATKRFSMVKGKLHNRSYGSEKFFRLENARVDCFASLTATLDRLTRMPHAFVVRGEPLPGINHNRTRRLLHPDRKTGDAATFTPARRHWFAVDLDHIAAAPLIDGATDPDGAIEHLIGLLPPDLQDATCWWQFTSSQGLPGHEEMLSVRLWYWSSVPLDDAALKRWAAAANRHGKIVDPALYSAVQAHYVAAPIFIGMSDPVPRRYGVRRGLEETVDLIIPPPDQKNPENVSGAGYEPGRGAEAYLAEIGGAEGVRRPILSAIASYIAIHGSNADCEPLKKAIRQAIDQADLPGYSDDVLERYKSDQHLDEIVAWVRNIHGDQPPKQRPTPEPPPEFDQNAPPPHDSDPTPIAENEAVTLDDFRAYMPMHNYIFMPSRDLWPSSSVNARLKPVTIGRDEDGKPVAIPASVWLDKNRAVEQMTWVPGLPAIIQDRLIIEGGWVARKDVACFNLYMPPTLAHGDPKKAGPWLDHVRLIYPDDAEHILSWLAHRVRRPQEKINHALILSGPPGIGKDTLLEPVKRTIGPWNFREASPSQVLGRFNGFLKGVILRISEIKDLGEADRYAFYEHMKAIEAAPPDVLRCDEKHIREHAILNVCGVVYTTNYKAEGLYLPADDRRHYVAWSRRAKEDFSEAYWTSMWAFFDNGGDGHIAAYLAQRDLSAFNPKAPPPKTDAFWDIVNAHRASETAELADVLDNMGNPDAVTLREIITDIGGSQDFSDWLKDRKNRTKIPHRFEECGYTPVRNPDADDGLWRIRSKREVVYSKSAYSLQARIAAAEKLR